MPGSRKSFGRGRKKRRSFGRRKKSPESVFWTIVVVIFALVGSGFIVYELVPLASIFAGSREEAADNPPTAETESEEKVVSDWEPKAPGEYHNIMLLGVDDQGMGDAIMVFSHHIEANRSALISVKRDTYIAEQTWGAKELGQDHLAWAYYRGLGADEDCHGGASLCAGTLEQLLGIDIHSYASVSFDGFKAMIDLLGGVEVEVAPEFTGRYGSNMPSGLQRLDGRQALTFACHRMDPRIPEPGSTSQDGDRVRRNQVLLQAILEESRNRSDEELLDLFEQLDDKICTSLEYWDIFELINLLYYSDPEELQTYVLPGEGEMVYQELIDQEVYYFMLDEAGSEQILKKWGLR